MEALNDVDIGAADRVERPHLVLSVFECALFMRRKLAAERMRDRLAEIGRCLQRKQPRGVTRLRSRRNIQWRPDRTSRSSFEAPFTAARTARRASPLGSGYRQAAQANPFRVRCASAHGIGRNALDPSAAKV